MKEPLEFEEVASAIEKAPIFLLKRKIRHHYHSYMDIFDGVDCGHHLLQYISLRASRHARVFNAAMDRLTEIDSGFNSEFRL